MSTWGEGRLGRKYNVASRMMGILFGNQFGGFNQLNTGAGLGFSGSNWVRYDNLALYESPSFGGFRLSEGSSFNAKDLSAAQSGFVTADNTSAITSGLIYNNGTLLAFIAYEQMNESKKIHNAK